MSLRERERGRATERETSEQAMGTEELLELLDANYTQAILEASRGEPKSASDLAEECGASRPTVYRRLNSLQDAGLVETGMAYDADGHHRTVFEATLESMSVDVGDEGLSVTVETNPTERRPPRRSGPVPTQ
jgi:DNA-binding IclR family transcriptional regulator